MAEAAEDKELEIPKADGAADDGAAISDAASDSDFEAAQEVQDPDALVINIEGFEGPLDVLLTLARKQKVDLKKISILALVEQYLEFIERAKLQRLEIAADYLVMAAWLAYLKSRLLLPEQESEDDEPTGEELAARLAFRLRQLESMREAGQKLLASPQLMRDVFPRGAPEGVRDIRTAEWSADLFDLLNAYSDGRVRTIRANYRPATPPVYALEAARLRLESMLGFVPEWRTLDEFLPSSEQAHAPRRSTRASTFSAALELAKGGRLELRQNETYGPIYLRGRQREDGEWTA